jgi:8-oxo-dGTP diphosphatase
MSPTQEDDLNRILEWCASVVGPCEVATDDLRFHGRTSVLHLRTRSGACYLKLHRQRSFWENEVHGYERWAPAFGASAPPLLAVHEDEPLALLVGELPGRAMESVSLSVDQERAVWHAAGRALTRLHDLAPGDCFGLCHRDGSCAGPPVGDAVEYVTADLERQTAAGRRAGCLDEREASIVRAAQGLTPAFAGERPCPCHRDYGPANWLIAPDGTWAGVIDFEFAYWDVRVTDFCRYPDWEWMRRPELVHAFFQGYGRPLTPREEQQCLVAHILYALGAIVWGHENAFYGFEAEGHQALAHIAGLLG